jgi:hypothetical protein
MKHLSNLDQQVLRWASDDFEAPHTIASNVSSDLGCVVDEQEILSSFVRLSHLRLVQPFQYDPEAQQFFPVQLGALSKTADPWFLAVSSVAMR